MNLFNMVSFRKEKAAFTLAEVLITIGIIGVVAALTIPILIGNVQDIVKQKRVENIKQKLSKVTDKMAVQSGLIGYNDTMAFVQEMAKHMNIVKICDNSHLDDCWPTSKVDLNKDNKTWEIAKTKNAKSLKINKDIRDNWADTVGIVTADGVPMILSYDKTCDFDVDKTGLLFNKDSAMSTSVGCLSGVFDWNGGKNPNKLGKDVLTIGMAAGLGNDCAIEVGGKCFTALFSPKPLTESECLAEKDHLGIEDCNNDTDYWAGAVKQCGGMSKMPTIEDLTELAKVLYNTSNVDSSAKLSLDTSKAAPFGITNLNSGVIIWSNNEYYDAGCYCYRVWTRVFSSDKFWYQIYDNYKGRSRNQAFCLAD